MEERMNTGITHSFHSQDLQGSTYQIQPDNKVMVTLPDGRNLTLKRVESDTGKNLDTLFRQAVGASNQQEWNFHTIPSDKKTYYAIRKEDEQLLKDEPTLQKMLLEIEEESRLKVYEGTIITSDDTASSDPLYLNLAHELKALGKGGFGEVGSYQAIYETDSPKESRYIEESVAVKTGQVKGDMEGLNRIWAKIEKEVGSDNLHLVRGIQPKHIKEIDDVQGDTKVIGEQFDGTLLSSFNTSNDKKAELAYQLIEGLYWMQTIGEPHRDIKPQNCLVKEDIAVIIDHPNSEFLNEPTTDEEAMRLIKNILSPQHYSPEWCDVQTRKNIQELLKAKQTKNSAMDALDLFQQEQSFAMGMTLYSYFVGDYPYPMAPLPKGRSTTDWEEAELTFPSKLMRNLTDNGCPKKLARLITKLIDPDPDARPICEDLVSFIVNHNPDLKPHLKK
jgi:hypothetical protein